MKKLLFVCYGLGIGGIEKCLVNLINVLPEDRFDIDVLLMNPEYDSKSQIKRNVHYLDSYKYVMNTTDTMQEIKERGGVVQNLSKFIVYCVFRGIVKLRLSGAWKTFCPLEKEYDIAIAYSQNDYSPYYVIDKVKAARKVLWYHNGAYEKTVKAYEWDKKYYLQFDYIVAVSTDCAKVLNEKFYFESGKLIVLQNICDIERIVNQAEYFFPESYNNDKLHIATVGRLTREKGADLAVDVCKRLVDEGYLINWHWIGDGNQRETMEKLIAENDLQGVFLLEGNQSNPYPFMKNCDIYVQPSYYEAYSTTITEARVLRKPIVTTDVGGMRDQIKDGVNGFIAAVDPDMLAERIRLLIEDKEKRQAFSDKLSENRIDNQNALMEYEQTVFS